jgi:hypothetical protein
VKAKKTDPPQARFRPGGRGRSAGIDGGILAALRPRPLERPHFASRPRARRPQHPDKILITPSAKGGIAAGWAFYDIRAKGIAPKAFVFGVTNPVMVQGAVFAGITITEGWSASPYDSIRTGDIVRVDPGKKTLTLLRRGNPG